MNPTQQLTLTPEQQATLNASNAAGTAASKQTGIAFKPIDTSNPVPPPAPAPTGGAQPGSKVENQGKPGFDVFGNPVQQDNTNTNTGATGPSETTTTAPTTDQLSTQVSNDQQLLQQKNDEMLASAKQFSDTITGIQNGSVPLDAGQQAQIQGLQSQFQDLINKQVLVNTGATGIATVRGFQTGAAEYDPSFAAKTIGALASAGAAKIGDLQVKMASAVAALTQSFKDNNIAKVKEAYDTLTAAQDKYRAQVQKTIDETQAAIKQAQDQQDKQRTYELDVQKFQQTKDQNAFDNAFKVEQEKFAEQKAAQTEAETARHNKASEAIDAFKAGMGAGNGNGIGNNIPSAQLTPSGNADPVSQKQTLDTIAQKYGPMTAIAIKGLADYSINPADWSSRATKGMTREQAVTLAKMVDPTYSDAMFATRATYMKNLASNAPNTIGAAINSANKAINHLVAFDTSTSKLGNIYPIEALNAMSQAGRAITPGFSSRIQENQGQAQTEANGVKDELARFFKGSGATDVKSIEDWQKSVSTTASDASRKGAVQGAINLMEGQLSALKDQYTSTMGKEPINNFLSKEALNNLSALKNKGYEVNIPGVNYTDKDAYLKGGGSQEALTKAYNTLVTANDPNNPPTAENVLELAQIQ